MCEEQATGLQLSGATAHEAGACMVTAELFGKEDNLSYGSLQVPIDQWRYAAKIEGAMSTQRNPMHDLTELRLNAVDRLVDFAEEDCWRGLYQGACTHLIALGHKTATQHPNLYYYDRPDADAVPGNLENMNTNVLDAIDLWFSNGRNPITMMKNPMDHTNYGVVVMSELQFNDLCFDNRFWELQKDALKRVMSSKERAMHPLFNGAHGYWKNLCIWKTTRVWTGEEMVQDNDGNVIATFPADLAAGHHCALALGARAAAWANGGYANENMGQDKNGNVRFKFVTDPRTDYENEVNLGLLSCYGIVRADFEQDARRGGNDPAVARTVNQSSAVFVTNTSGRGDFYAGVEYP